MPRIHEHMCVNVCLATHTRAHAYTHESVHSAYEKKSESDPNVDRWQENSHLVKHLRNLRETDSLTLSLEMFIGDLNNIIMQTCLPLYPPFLQAFICLPRFHAHITVRIILARRPCLIWLPAPCVSCWLQTLLRCHYEWLFAWPPVSSFSLL